MHEFSIARNIVKIVLQQPQVSNLQTVKCVKLIVGDLTGIVSESLIFCFELASRGTAAQGSRLKIEHVSGNELDIVGVELEEQSS